MPFYSIDTSMSRKVLKKRFYGEEEDKKCPPQHVSRSNPNEVAMKDNAGLSYEEVKEEVKEGDLPAGHIPESSLYEWWARNEAGTAHDLDTKERIDFEDPGMSSGNKDRISHLRGPDNSPGSEAVDSHAHPPMVTSKRRSWTHPPIPHAGAFRQGGLDNVQGNEEDAFTVTIGEEEDDTIEPSPPTLSAQLVNREEEKNRAVLDFLQNAVVADVVPEAAPDNSGKRWKLAGLLLVLIVLIVVGVVLTITLRPDPDPTLSPESLSDMLSAVSSDNGEALSTNSTPQNKAFNWMVNNNTRLGAFSKEQIIQRYALATLYYSANGDNWDNNEFWLDNGEECGRWVTSSGPLGCTDIGAAFGLDLMFNNLNGIIPPEIGLMTLLGECVPMIDCHEMLAQSLWASIRIHLVILMVSLDYFCRLTNFLEQYLDWTNPN
jgi:hypothetical protein